MGRYSEVSKIWKLRTHAFVIWRGLIFSEKFLGIWEQLFNPCFNPLEFEGVRKEAGLNAFTMSPSRWIESENRKFLK